MSVLSKARWLAVATLAAVAVVVVSGAVRPYGAYAGAGRGWPMKKQGDLWIVETPHYQFETDHDPKAAQLMASHQEALFRELYRRMGKTKAVSGIKRMKVQVFQTRDRYRKALGVESEGSQGLYTGSAIAVWAVPEGIDDLLETLRHEGTHQFVGQFIGNKCPVWLNEGLAVFFQNARFEQGKLVIGQVPMPTVNVLKKAAEQDRLIPMEQMLAMSYKQWGEAVKTKSKQASVQYPQAWSMVHFLEEGENGKYRAPLLQYIYYLSRGLASEQAWKRSFGTNVKAFEQRWRAYIKNLEATEGIPCRMKLKMLGEWVLEAMKKPSLLKDMETLRKVALTGVLGGWTVTLGDVETEITDAESVKDLFRCPLDKSNGDAPSYELVWGEPGEPPVVRCTRHAGVVLETAYEKNAEGGWVVRAISRPVLPGEKKAAAKQ